MESFDVLNNCILFSDISDETKNRMLKDTRTSCCTLNEGDYLFCENKNTEPVICILSDGILEVFREHNGARVLLNEIKAPGIVGASILFGSDKQFQTTVKAKKKCHVILFQQSQLVELIKENGDFAIKYISFLSDKIRFLNKRIASFTSGSAASRLAYYLIKNSKNGTCEISRTRLASEIDVGRASLYRAIDTLSEHNLIQTDGKKIIISDEQKLLAFSEEEE